MGPMHGLTLLFIALALGGAMVRQWLLGRQVDAVRAHRESVPAPFAETISLADHQRAADFTMAHARLTSVEIVVGTVVLLALTVGGGIDAIDRLWDRSGWSNLWQGAAVIASVIVLMSVVDLPLSVWRTFRIEARFGFNRTTPALYVADLLKGLLLGVLLGGPLLLAILWLMEHAGTAWWIIAWVLWVSFTLLVTWAWPTFIAPLFNKFEPLTDEALRSRVEALLGRCGFKAQGVFVMDGSRRSSHGNAYFTGLGRNKRIVFFDTLVERLQHPEIEAVLAHELGHFRLHHVRKRLLVSLAMSFAGLALLGQLATWPAFFHALGVTTPSNHTALLLFMLATPVVTFFVTPLGAWWSRRHEFEADHFASTQAAPLELAEALVKLYRDNASTLTPDPVYAAFYYSHPPALARIGRLKTLAGAQG
jgi:STE24 endopeptidase